MVNSQKIKFSILDLKTVSKDKSSKFLFDSLLSSDTCILGSIVEESYNLPVRIIVSYNENDDIVGYLWVYQTGESGSKLNFYSFRNGLSVFNCEYKDFIQGLCNFCSVSNIRLNGIYIQSNKCEIISSENIFSDKKNITLPLNKNIDQCWKDLPKKTRNMVRKGKKSDIKLSNNKSHLFDFYKIYSANMLNKRVVPHSLEFFEKMMEGFGDKIDLITAIYRNKVIGGIIVQYGESVASYPFHSSIVSFNYLAPNHLLVWSMIEKCVNRGLTCIDMGEGSVGSGVYSFKKSFGGDVRVVNKICLENSKKLNVEKNKRVRKALSLIYYNLLKYIPVRTRSVIVGRKKRKINLGI